MTVAIIEWLLISVTVRDKDPSATRMRDPTFTEVGRDAYEQAI